MANGDLQSLGTLLRQTREARALSFEEVEAQTRIRVKFLQALESGDISVLPSVAHAKGFLRNYAQFLRLDANAIVAQFGELTGSGAGPVTTPTATPIYTQPPAAPPAAGPTVPAFDQPLPPHSVTQPPTPIYPPVQSPAAPRPTVVPPDRRVGPAAPLAMGRGGTESARAERPRSAVGRLFQSNLIVGAILLVGMLAIAGWVVMQLSTVTGEELIPTDVAGDAPAGFATSGTVEASPTFPPTSTPPSVVGPTILDRVLLTITITQRAWTRVTVDGEVVFEGQAEKGIVLQYTGMQTIIVLTGNAAGLSVNYNGQDLGPLGERGQVVERIFTPSAQLSPTPTLTPSPTPTNVPTPTPRGGQSPTRQP